MPSGPGFGREILERMMEIKAVFGMGAPVIYMTPDNEREKKLLGICLDGEVEVEFERKFEGHFSHQSISVVKLTLREKAKP
jgi:hypothetical protein